ncbi:MAG: restriction endonuclease [Phycisphaerales bacterium]|nr:restriction endonuclease [Phycisphaerales bacterium]
MDKKIELAVRRRADGICEYCRFPEVHSELRFVIDHIVARQHGGATTLANLALACGFCNRHKGPNVAGVDPSDGSLARLFHPRTDDWRMHFQWDGAEIVGQTAIARATVRTLALNDPMQIDARRAIILCGRTLY